MKPTTQISRIMAAALLVVAITLVSCEKKAFTEIPKATSVTQTANTSAATHRLKPLPKPIEDPNPVIKSKESEERLADEWGIKVHSLRLSSAGHMIDLRFRVLDPEKAKPLLQRGAAVYLEHPESGRKFFVPSSPKTGSLRATALEPVKGRIYYTLFANPGGFIQSGTPVTAVIGDLKAEKLIVQ